MIQCEACVDRPVCDFCAYYRYNGDAQGVYIGEGQCAHPAHPGERDPGDGCDDFCCSNAASAPAEHVKDHVASIRREAVR